MNRASLLDVFQAASGFGQQALGIYSREKQYHLATRLYEAANELSKLQDEWAAKLAAVDPDGENPYQSNPEEYKKDYAEALASWRGRAEKAGNGSRYYTGQLAQIAAQGDAVMARKTLEAADAFDRKQGYADLQKNLTAAENDPYNDTWDKKLDAQLVFYRAAVNRNLLDPARAAEVEKAVYERNFKKRITLEDDGVRTAAEAEELVRKAGEERRGEFEKFVDDIPGRIDAAAEAAKVQIIRRDLDNLLAEDAVYDREARDAINTNNPAGIAEARGLQKAGAEKRDAMLKRPEFAGGDRAKIASTFRKFGELEPGYGGGGGGRKTVTEGDVRDALSRMADGAMFGGYGGASLTTVMASPEALPKAVEMVMKELKERGKDPGSSPYAFYQEYSGVFDDITKIAVDRVKENFPAIAFAVEDVSKWLKDAFKPGGMLYEEDSGKRQSPEYQSRMLLLQGYGADLVTNALLDEGLAAGGEEAAVKRLMGIKDTIAAKKLDTLPRQTAGNGKNSGEYLGELFRQYYNRDLAILDDKGRIKTHPALGDEWVNGVLGKMKRQVAEYLADFNGISSDTAMAGLVDPEWEKQTDAGGVSDVDLPSAFGFMGELYRAYPEGKTYEIQKYDAAKKKWEKAPGRSGDSASLIQARGEEFYKGMVEELEKQGMLSSRGRDFYNSRRYFDDDDTSIEAQYQRRTEELFTGEMKTKQLLLEYIRTATNSRDREEQIQRGLRTGLLTHKEAEEERNKPVAPKVEPPTEKEKKPWRVGARGRDWK
jgi:hypothetical protein